jgi:prepilin-type processing-associated H-X9-DG protein
VHAPEDFYDANGLDVRFTPYTYGPYKVSEHFKPAPSGVFVFIDEHEESINSGLFLIPQGGCSWWNSLPADRHRQGSNLSFLDGHVEHWRWKVAKVYKGFLAAATVGDDANDLARLQDATPQDLIR